MLHCSFSIYSIRHPVPLRILSPKNIKRLNLGFKILSKQLNPFLPLPASQLPSPSMSDDGRDNVISSIQCINQWNHHQIMWMVVIMIIDDDNGDGIKDSHWQWQQDNDDLETNVYDKTKNYCFCFCSQEVSKIVSVRWTVICDQLNGHSTIG